MTPELLIAPRTTTAGAASATVGRSAQHRAAPPAERRPPRARGSAVATVGPMIDIARTIAGVSVSQALLAAGAAVGLSTLALRSALRAAR